jgi:hypothetical protein
MYAAQQAKEGQGH